MVTPAKARRLLLKFSEAANPSPLYPFIYEALLGRHVIWATFDADHPDQNPFDRLPHSREGIRMALGLGHLSADDSLILLVWGHRESGSPPLHRPTVADAEHHPYYRPHHKAGGLWGFTEPLPPNPEGLPPQPEVVMSETASQGLRLPFRVFQA